MGIPAHGYGYADSHSVPTSALGFVDGSREWDGKRVEESGVHQNRATWRRQLPVRWARLNAIANKAMLRRAYFIYEKLVTVHKHIKHP